MKNKDTWKPSKFVMTKRGCRASRDTRVVGIGSRFIAGIQARVYENAIREHARGVLLDLGCGRVPLYEVYKDYISDNVCVDWSHAFHENPYSDHEFNLNEVIPLESERFDTILLTDVLEHISNPDMLWREMARMLKPGGKVIVGVPFLHWIHEEPYDYYRYTEHKLRAFCESNGLAVVSLEPYGGSPEVVLDIVAKHISFSRILSAVHLLLSNVFVKSFVGRKLSARTSRYFTPGYCLVARKEQQMA